MSVLKFCVDPNCRSIIETGEGNACDIHHKKWFKAWADSWATICAVIRRDVKIDALGVLCTQLHTDLLSVQASLKSNTEITMKRLRALEIP